jgi:hypothetical protein
MKRSHKIILGTLFCAAVSAAANGQDMQGRSDSSSHQAINGVTGREHGGGFFSFLMPHHGGNPGNTSHMPRTGGFGNTLRSASS